MTHARMHAPQALLRRSQAYEKMGELEHVEKALEGASGRGWHIMRALDKLL
jgi:hypothetical protein